MIQVQLIKTGLINESGIILQNLNNSLANEKFSGKIYLTYKEGILEHVKIEQSFNKDALIEALR